MWLFERRWAVWFRYSAITIIVTLGPMLWFYFGNVATVPNSRSLLIGIAFALIGMTAAAAHIMLSFAMIYLAARSHQPAILRVLIVFGIALCGGLVAVPYYYFFYLPQFHRANSA